MLGIVFVLSACDSGPTEPALGTVWVTLTAGYRHTCGLTDAGRVFCWGDNGAGQTGRSPAGPDAATPHPVETTLRFSALSAGRNLSCGVTTDFAIHCWGSGASLGRGEGPVPTCDRDGIAGPCPYLPSPIESDVEFVDVSVGGAYEYWDGSVRGGPVCALARDGTAYCWGYGALGARGDGTARSTSIPTPLAGDLRFAEIAVDEGGGCGITLSGELYCWGTNANHRLARDDREYSAVPVEISSPDTWERVAVGPTHACAVTTDGVGRCWGLNDYGALGDGTIQNRSVPTPVAGGLELALIAAATSHTSALDRRGRTYSWGYTYFTGTGEGGTVRQRILAPAPVAWSQELAAISSGGYHTCGLTAAGEAYCWGDGGWGQLGTGDLSTRSIPARVLPP